MNFGPYKAGWNKLLFSQADIYTTSKYQANLNNCELQHLKKLTTNVTIVSSSAIFNKGEVGDLIKKICTSSSPMSSIRPCLNGNLISSI